MTTAFRRVKVLLSKKKTVFSLALFVLHDEDDAPVNANIVLAGCSEYFQRIRLHINILEYRQRAPR